MGFRFCVDKPLNKADVLERRRSLLAPGPLELPEPELEFPVLVLEVEFIFYLVSFIPKSLLQFYKGGRIPQEYTLVAVHHAPRRYDVRNDHPENRASVEVQRWSKEELSTKQKTKT